ncbi:MAG: repressor LexA [Elusimicrobia bacterium]|nr:repressor LexA [Elusimicrobiota bacterium]
MEALKPAGGFDVVLLGHGEKTEAEPLVAEQAADVEDGVAFLNVGEAAVVVDVVAVDEEGPERGVVAPAAGLAGAAVGGAGRVFPKAFDPFGHGHVGAAQRDLAGRADGDRRQDGQAVVVVRDRRSVDGGVERRRSQGAEREGEHKATQKGLANHVFFCIVVDMEPLTERQNQIYQFVQQQIQSRGFPPTVREIARHFRVFPKAVQDHLAALERKGVLRRVQERARGLVLEARGLVTASLRLPILGRVPAGVPLEAIADVEDYLAVDEAMAKRANFVLRVKGDSMAPMLLDSDMVLVQHTPVADNGDIVVATVDDGESTVKRLRRGGREYFLEPINPAYPILRGNIAVVGKVTSLIRTFF